MSLNLGSTYNLTLHAAQILGAKRERVLVFSAAIYDESIHHNLQLKHRSALSFLPNGTPRTLDHTLIYSVANTQAGVTVSRENIPALWLAQSELVEYQGLSVRLPTASHNDIELIRQALLDLGYTQFEITPL